MKIVFTTKGIEWNSPMDARFGRAEYLVVYDDKDGKLVSVSNNEVKSMQHGAGLQTSKKVLKLGAEVIITGNGAGEKALDILKSSEIKIFVGAGEMSVEDAYKAFKNNQLEKQK